MYLNMFVQHARESRSLNVSSLFLLFSVDKLSIRNILDIKVNVIILIIFIVQHAS